LVCPFIIEECKSLRLQGTAAGDKPRLRTVDDGIWVKLKQTATNRNFVAWTLMQWLVYCNTVFQTKFFHMCAPLLKLTTAQCVGWQVLWSLLSN
jgi:hypothetical protein